jgi:hypothetical protein
MVSASGALDWLPPSFEWPFGYADVLTLPNGIHIAAHMPSSRIQVYDGDWRFLRGWHVRAYAGFFKLLSADENHVELITQRQSRQLIFSLHGHLVFDGPSPLEYSAVTGITESQRVPTPWLLLPFSNPFFS